MYLCNTADHEKGGRSATYIWCWPRWVCICTHFDQVHCPLINEWLWIMHYIRHCSSRSDCTYVSLYEYTERLFILTRVISNTFWVTLIQGKIADSARLSENGIWTDADSVAPDQSAHTIQCPFVSQRCLFFYSLYSVTLRSDSVDVRADLQLYCPHMSEYPVSHDASYIS